MTCITELFTGIKHEWDHFPPRCFAGSADSQLPPQWDTSTSLCAAALSWHQPEQDAPQKSSRKHASRTRVFLDSSRVCCEDERGTCGLSEHWRGQVIRGLSEQAPRPVTPDTVQTSEGHRAARQFLRRRADVHHSAKTSENWNCNFYKGEQFLFHIAEKL